MQIESNHATFSNWAGNSFIRWRHLMWQQVTHKIYGEGTVIKIERSPVFRENSLYIRFGNEVRHCRLSTFGKNPNISCITLSPQTRSLIGVQYPRGTPDWNMLEADLAELETELEVSRTGGPPIEKGSLPPGTEDSIFSKTRHCYNCKMAIDSRFEDRCNQCYWYKCNFCNACGCGYTGKF